MKNKLLFTKTTLEIFNELILNGAKVYVVGGVVRDLILEKDIDLSINDIDVEVHNVDSNKLVKILGYYGDVISIGKKFGVYKIKQINNIDFALPRTENKVGIRHKDFDVKFYKDIDLETASRRRDFTVNAMMYDVSNDKIYDFYNGISDCNNLMLDIVNEETFKEDLLRIFRAAKFISRYDFKPSDKLIKLCKEMLFDEYDISAEMIYTEMDEAFNGNYYKSAIDFLFRIGYFQGNTDFLKIISKLNIDPKNCSTFLWKCILFGYLQSSFPFTIGLKKTYSSDKKLLNLIENSDLNSKTDYLIFVNENFDKMSDINFINWLKFLSVEENNSNFNIFLEFYDKYGMNYIVPLINGNDIINIGIKEGLLIKKMLKKSFMLQLEGMEKKEILSVLQEDWS